MINTKLTTISLSIAVLCGCGANVELKETNSRAISTIKTVSDTVVSAGLPVTSSTIGTASAADLIANKNSTRPIAKRASKAWLGNKLVEIQNDELLPPVFYEAQKFNFGSNSKNSLVPLRTIAERVSVITGVPVRVALDNSSQSSSIGAAPAMAMPLPRSAPMPVHADPAMFDAGAISSSNEPMVDLSSIQMSWDKNLAGFLDHITNQLGLSWSYRGGTAIIESMLTETFSLSTFGTEQSYKMELTGGNSGQSSNAGSGSSSSSALEMSEKGKTDTLKSLLAAVENIVKPAGGSVILNDATSRFYVTAPKDAITKVRKIFEAEEEIMMRQAHIQIDIYSVIIDNADEKSIDWTLAWESLKDSWGAVASSPASLAGSMAGNLQTTIIQDARGSREFAGSSAMIKMLNTIGTTVKHAPVSMVAMNRQWARKTNLKTDGYLSETTPSTSSSAGSGAPGLKTSQITTGDKFMIQPAILDSGSIILKFGISMTELLGLFDVTTGNGDTFQKVQTPVTTGNDDQTTIRLRPGEAMVVSGLSRNLSKDQARRLADGAPMLFGGSNTMSNQREDFIIVVRAVQLQ